MATMAIPSIGAPLSFEEDSDAIEWRKAISEVRRLQMSIAKVVRKSDRDDQTTGSGSHPAFARA